MIRSARPADAPAMAACHAASFDRGWSRSEIADLLNTPGACAVVMENTPENGFALARIGADEAELLTIAVAPQARRQGLGAALLSALERACAEAGAVALYLDVSVKNAAARRLYARSAYEEVGFRPGYYADGSDALLMRKPL